MCRRRGPSQTRSAARSPKRASRPDRRHRRRRDPRRGRLWGVVAVSPEAPSAATSPREAPRPVRMPLPAATDVSVGRLRARVEATAYFVVIEALANVVSTPVRIARMSAGAAHRRSAISRDDGSSWPQRRSACHEMDSREEARGQGDRRRARGVPRVRDDASPGHHGTAALPALRRSSRRARQAAARRGRRRHGRVTRHTVTTADHRRSERRRLQRPRKPRPLA
jgi:hypothetical protein